MGRELRARGLVAADGRDQNSVATGAGEIDGADKRDRYQKNLLKNCEGEVQAALQRVRPVFSMGYIAGSVHGSRQKRTDVGCNLCQPGTGTTADKPALVFPCAGDSLQLLLSRIEPSPV